MKPAAAHPIEGAEVWPLSTDAYHTLSDAGIIPERTELLYGVVYRKMSKSPLHSYLVQLLQELLLNRLSAGLCLRVEQPLTLLNSEPEPDLAIVKGSPADYRVRHPVSAELVIEVCVTTHEFDRPKLPAYAAGNVKECWLVLGPEKQVEVFRDAKGGAYQDRIVLKGKDILQHVSLPSLKVSIEDLFR
jgi:Uma2 family endonuclease